LGQGLLQSVVGAAARTAAGWRGVITSLVERRRLAEWKHGVGRISCPYSGGECRRTWQQPDEVGRPIEAVVANAKHRADQQQANCDCDEAEGEREDGSASDQDP